MKKILILAGGYSKEKEVSIQTAKSVYSELNKDKKYIICLLYTSPSPRDGTKSRMPSSA